MADPSAPITETVLTEVQRAAQTLQLQLTSYGLRDVDALDRRSAICVDTLVKGAKTGDRDDPVERRLPTEN